MPRRPANFLLPAFVLLCALLSGCGKPPPPPAPPPPAAADAAPVSKDWKMDLEYFPPPSQSQVKTRIAGQDYTMVGNNLIKLQQPSILNFRTNGAVEMTMSAPDCVLDVATKTASSSGHLQILSTDGRTRIEGNGFYWEQTNSVMTISNNVVTTFARSMLGPSTVTNTPSDTNQPVRVRADSLVFDRNANLITYRGNIHVEDVQMELLCDRLIIQRTPDDKIDAIVADQNVVIISRTTTGRATGEHAVYSGALGGQLVTLTGDPHWHNGSSEGTATAFVFDLEHNLFREQGNAYLTLPSASIRNLGTLFVPQPGTSVNPPNTNAAATNFVQLYSEVMTFQLPPTNGPIQSITADTNVIILDAEHQGRASSDHASYSATNGVLELTGHALGQAGRTVTRGDTLRFDTNNLAFAAIGNAYLKFPFAAPATTNTPRSTNQFLEVSCGSYDYVSNRLTFHAPVRAAWLDGDTILGTGECGDTLTADFVGTNLVALAANSDVHTHQLPTLMAPGRTIERDLKTDHLQARMRTNDWVDNIVARGNVFATQTETRTNTNGPATTVLTLNADSLNALFRQDTNQLDHVTAEQNVLVNGQAFTGQKFLARGAKAVFTAADNVALLTGDPRAEMPNSLPTTAKGTAYSLNNGWVVARDGISYNIMTGRIQLLGPFHLQTGIDGGLLAKTNKPAAPPH